MADHFGGEIFTIAVAGFFIVSLLMLFGISLSESAMEIETITQESDFDQSWLNLGNNWYRLQDIIPAEFFIIIIVPIILLGLYIAIKTVSGVLPNWISGG